MPLTDDLRAFWILNQSQGSRIDSSGNGNDWTSDTVETRAAPCVGIAAFFRGGLTETLRQVTSSWLELGNFTFYISGFIFPASTQAASGGVLSKGLSGSFIQDYTVLYTGATHSMSFQVRDTADTLYKKIDSSVSMTPDTWYFVEMAYTGSDLRIAVTVPGNPASAWETLAYSGGVHISAGECVMGSTQPNSGGLLTDSAIYNWGIWGRLPNQEERDFLAGAFTAGCPPSFTCFSQPTDSDLGCFCVSAAGKTITFTVTTSPPGPIVYTSPSWIVVSGPSSGSGTVTAVVAANLTGVGRTGLITVNDTVFTVTQAG